MSAPFVPLYRQFPTEDAKGLERQLVNFHNQISYAVNSKTIGAFDTNAQPNGERWFPASGSRTLRDGNRQAYVVTTAGSYPHGIDTTQISAFTRIYGTFLDNMGNFFPLPYVNVVAVNNQISLYVSPTDIVITAGAGTPPTMVSGFVVLEWI